MPVDDTANCIEPTGHSSCHNGTNDMQRTTIDPPTHHAQENVLQQYLVIGKILTRRYIHNKRGRNDR